MHAINSHIVIVHDGIESRLVLVRMVFWMRLSVSRSTADDSRLTPILTLAQEGMGEAHQLPPPNAQVLASFGYGVLEAVLEGRQTS